MRHKRRHIEDLWEEPAELLFTTEARRKNRIAQRFPFTAMFLCDLCFSLCSSVVFIFKNLRDA